jgi:hypothetical protein
MDTISYRDFEIRPSLVSYMPQSDWTYTHKDYDPTPVYADDGPSDNRCGYAGSVEEAKAEIDEFYSEQEAA